MNDRYTFNIEPYLLKEHDFAHIKLRDEAVKNAMEKVAKLNEKTAEQVLLVKQQQRIAELEEALQYIARESAMARTGEKPIDICMGSIGFIARQALKDSK